MKKDAMHHQSKNVEAEPVMKDMNKSKRREGEEREPI